MNKSVSMMQSISDVCDTLRYKFYGNGASPRDYKDSYIINAAIERFNTEEINDLMDEKISEKDRSENKTAKSINFRSDCYDKLCDIAKTLNLPESEALRRLLIYSLENNDISTHYQDFKLSSLKGKLTLLKKQVTQSLMTIDELTNEIERLESESRFVCEIHTTK